MSFTKAEDYSMNQWWFRHVHVRTYHHQRNVDEAAGIINSVPPIDSSPNDRRFLYAKGIMKGCGCNVLA